MKRFLIRLVMFLFPLLFIAVMIETGLRSIPNDYKLKKAYLDGNSDDVRILILGSSHSYYGIIPELIDPKAYNASYVSQSLEYDFEILKKYEGKWGNLKTIILAIDYPTLFSKLSENKESWRIKNYQIYYQISKSYNLKDNFEIFAGSLPVNLTRLYLYYTEGECRLTSSKTGYGSDNRKQKDLDKTAIKASKRHTKNDFRFFSFNISILNKILNFAKEREIQVLIYTSPAYKGYREALDSVQLEKTTSAIDSTVKVNSHCENVDFLFDPDFKNEHFRDADHLNHEGAMLLSLKLKNTLQGL